MTMSNSESRKRAAEADPAVPPADELAVRLRAMADGYRPRCPVHNIPDCSVLLNGCTRPQEMHRAVTEFAARFLDAIPAPTEPTGEREADRLRAEGLTVAAITLRRILDYWDGRPTTHHGDHIFGHLAEALRSIEADAAALSPTPHDGAEGGGE